MWWGWIVGAAAVLFVVFVVVFRPFQRGQHAASRALPVTRVDLPAVGSMSLADEQTYWSAPPPPWLPPAEPWLTAPLAAPVLVGPYGGQLGPRAQLVWDRWDTRCRERWGFSCVS